MFGDLAVKYNATPTQVILGWGLARGVSLATQSKSEAHRKEILNVRRAESSVSGRRCTNDIIYSSLI